MRNLRTISYQRVRNLGNYESERLEAVLDLTEGEDPHVAFVRLKRFVEGELGLNQSLSDNGSQALDEVIF